MPNLYKLEYQSKYDLDSSLINKGILIQDDDGVLVYSNKTHAVVYLGHIILKNQVFDSNGNKVSNSVLSDKYHADIMTDEKFDFGSSEVAINNGENVAHCFLGVA